MRQQVLRFSLLQQQRACTCKRTAEAGRTSCSTSKIAPSRTCIRCVVTRMQSPAILLRLVHARLRNLCSGKHAITENYATHTHLQCIKVHLSHTSIHTLTSVFCGGRLVKNIQGRQTCSQRGEELEVHSTLTQKARRK
jgi:hypothetical protein